MAAPKRKLGICKTKKRNEQAKKRNIKITQNKACVPLNTKY